MASDNPLAPDFIRFLFSSKPKFDCYFEVRNKSQDKPERIGAVKLMLMAHSDVFRLELEDSDLKEKGDVPVKDVHPDTFKGMLKYVYGHDTTSDLCFDEADNMLYLAEKYMIKTLKNKLAVRLMKLLNPDNIFSLLNNPACYTHLELDSAITEILRHETDHVLASPQFLWVNADGFLKILEQDGLAVPEIELWRAAIKWAKHRANSEDGQLLRQQLSGLTRHLRLCTLTGDEICGEVATTGVLKDGEMNAVCKSVGRKRKPEGLTEICDEIVPRKRMQRKKTVEDAINLTKLNNPGNPSSCEYTMTFFTRHNTIELLPLECRSRYRLNTDPENLTYKVDCTTTITEVAKLNNTESCSLPTANKRPITVTFSENVKCGVEFEIPLAVDGRNITLLPDTKYTVKMELNGEHKHYYSRVSHSGGYYGTDHLTLAITLQEGYYEFPSTRLQYRATSVE